MTWLLNNGLHFNPSKSEAITFFNPRSKPLQTLAIRRDLHWLPIQARIQFKLNVITRNCLVGQAPAYLIELCRSINEIPARRNLYVRQHKSSSWSLIVSVRSALVVVASPSHHHNCGTYFQLTFDSCTRSHNFSERDSKLIVCKSPFFTTEDLCHQCDIYYYYSYLPNHLGPFLLRVRQSNFKQQSRIWVSILTLDYLSTNSI